MHSFGRPLLVCLAVAGSARPDGAAFAADCPVAPTLLDRAVRVVRPLEHSGFGGPVWIAVVDATGTVCAVSFSDGRLPAWDLARGAAVGKAVSAAGLSGTGRPVSTAAAGVGLPALGAASVPAGIPAGTDVVGDLVAVRAKVIGLRPTATTPVAGGLGLYRGAERIGGVGVAGDTPCADHSFAWRLRRLLDLEPLRDDLDKDRLNVAAGAHPGCPGLRSYAPGSVTGDREP